MNPFPPESGINSAAAQPPHLTWQELKESLARAISTRSPSLNHLRCLHARVLSSGLAANLYLSTLLVTRYSSFGDVAAALRVFRSHRPRPTKTLLWNAVLRGCLANGRPALALDVYWDMTAMTNCCSSGDRVVLPDSQTLHLAVTACTSLHEFEMGSRVAADARRRGLDSELLLGTALVNMHSVDGDLQSARQVFDRMTCRDVVSWNAMIAGYSREGCLLDVIRLYKKMRFEDGIGPTEATAVSLLSVCGCMASVGTGEVLHGHCTRIGLESDLFVINALMKMYIDCFRLESASRLFGLMVLKDAVAWSTIIGAFVRDGISDVALKLFHRMMLGGGPKPTKPVLLNVLQACGDMGDWHLGKFIEKGYLNAGGNKYESDECLNTAIVYMYAKCGLVDASLRILDEVLVIRKDVVAWNAAIKACTELGQIYETSRIALEMQRRGIDPDPATFLTLLSLFSSSSLLVKGMELHAHVVKRGFASETPISNALIDMYARCGNTKESSMVFKGIHEKDVVSWTSMIKAYAWNGNADEALDHFGQMRKTTTRPNHVTFVAILTACSQAGYVEEGKELFKCMKEEFGLHASLEHYACMVDLLCRAGCLSDAYDMLENGMMTNACKRSSVLWGSLLNACRAYGNCLVGEVAGRRLSYLEPRNAANYKALSDIYISAGRTEDANDVMRLLEEITHEKRPGSSWMETTSQFSISALQ